MAASSYSLLEQAGQLIFEEHDSKNEYRIVTVGSLTPIFECHGREAAEKMWKQVRATPVWFDQAHVVRYEGFWHSSDGFEAASSTTSETYIPILYATNRCPTRELPFFSSDRDIDMLHYGLTQVCIPAAHKFGQKRSSSILCRLGLTNDDSALTCVFFCETTLAGFQHCCSHISQHSSSSDYLLFVHGYNVPFDEAILSAAQLTFDGEFVGTTVCFSWPSNGKTASYVDDGEKSCSSHRAFSNLVSQILQQMDSSGRLHIVAHSMGNRILTLALQDPSFQRCASRIGSIVCAAPDVSVTDFTERCRDYFLACTLPEPKPKLSVYACGDDKALITSGILQEQRFGLNPVALKDVQVVLVEGLKQTTRVPKFKLFHSYVFENPLVVSDLFALVSDQERPNISQESSIPGFFRLDCTQHVPAATQS